MTNAVTTKSTTSMTGRNAAAATSIISGYIRKKCVLRLLFACFLLIAACTFALPAQASTKTISATLTKTVKAQKKSITVGQTARLKLKYNKTVISNSAVKFSSSSPSVATVTGDGTILAKKKGTAIIVASYKKRGVKINLTVKKAQNAASAQTQYNSSGIPDDVILLEEWLDSYDDVEPIDEEEENAKTTSTSSSSVSSLRQQIVAYAKSFVGVLPYVWGGNSLSSGTDCSGFVHLIYAHFGISSPRSASEFQSLSNISYSQLKPGDLVVYKNGGHVALYIGDDTVVHAKGAAYGTCKDSMWYGTPTGYVRLIKD